ncbi:beta strand repeat-containing protein [Actinokineospora fastidiosa]|uniref:Chaplin domain-containing protein n=1 Tax=Actinokineospora fastidiosa TaxID=1816 RepID=A0A918G5J1_9PSEU|nr:chaplin family protein [Actinokineospora fastidiosa]GGS19346.1 hypothetical protein GCM10010171_09920 [Actinokineospora fastidiosa]
MQTWAKRGIQTVLVTGGVMMLGTGIAAADDTIDPDAPPSALDATVKVPVRIDRNAIGTPMGSRHLPSVRRDVSVAPGMATRKLPVSRDAHDDDLFKDNQAVGTVILPAKATGNAVALGGDVSVADTSSQHVSHHQDVYADGSDETLAGNVVRLAYSLPIDVSGNAFAVADDAAVVSSSQQSAVNEGDVTTNGDDGVISGNVFAAHGATPVQATGNAVSLAGTASAAAAAESTASAGGAIETSGVDSLASGDAGGVPVAVPVRASGNTITKLGIAESLSSSSSQAHAGDEKPDLFRVPTYIQTDGKQGATASGNGVQTPVSGPVALDCNGVGDVGNTASQCETTSATTAGGGTRTFGDDSVVSGIVGGTPVALPVQGQDNCGALVGNCDTAGVNEVSSAAGGDTYTRGHDSVLGGTSLSVPVAGPVDACGNVAGAGGLATAVCGNTSTTEAGGNTGTTGDDSVFGGNNGSVPVAFPVEGLGNVVGALGDAESVVKEHKVSSAGGGNNTNDEAATGGANLVTVPVAGPLQAFSNGAGVGGNTQSQTDGYSDVTAGGPSRAKGTLGTLSGNIAQTPLAVPTQLFGSGASLVGNGKHVAANDTSSTSGGNAVTDGTDGNISGNLITAPVAAALQGFGVAGAVAGDEEAVGANQTDTTAGGDGATSGADGNIAGNIVGLEALPIVQAFGDGVAAVAADAMGVGANKTEGHSGGDLTTSGEGGYLAGNVLDVPAATLAQVHGNAVAAAAADAVGASDNVTTGSAGGDSNTDGDTNDLSGNDGQLPLGLELPIYDVPIEVLADAIADGNQFTDVTVGEEEPLGVTLPKAGALEATKPPALPNLSALPYPGGHGTSRFDRPDPLSALLGDGVAGSLGELTSLFNPGMARSNHNPLDGLLGGANPLSGLLGGANPLSGLLGQDPLGGVLGQNPLGDVASLDGIPGRTGLPLADGLPGRVTADIQNPLATSGGLAAVDNVPAIAGGLLGGTGAARADEPGSPLDGLTDALPLTGLSAPTGRADLPTGGSPLDGLTGGLGNPLDALSGLTGGVGRTDLPTGGNPVDALTDTLPLNAIPTGSSRADLPTGGSPLDGLTGGLGNPLDALSGLTGGVSRSDLPTGGSPLEGLTGGLDALSGLTGGVSRTDLPTGGSPLEGLTGGLDALSGLTGGVSRTDLPTSGNPLEGLTGGLDALSGLTGGVSRTDLPTSGNPVEGLTGGLDAVTGGLARADLPIGTTPLDGLAGGVSRADSPLAGNPLAGLLGGEQNPLAGLGGVTGGVGQTDNPLGAALAGTSVLGEILGMGSVTGRADLPGGGNPLESVTDAVKNPLGDLAGLGAGRERSGLPLPGSPVDGVNTQVSNPLSDAGELLGLTGPGSEIPPTGGVVESVLDGSSPLGDLGDLLSLGGLTGGAPRADVPTDNPLSTLLGGDSPLGDLGDLLGLGGLTGGGTGRADLPTAGDPLGGVFGGDPLGSLLGGSGSESPLGDLADLLGLGALTDASQAGLPMATDALGGLTGGGTGRADLPSVDNPLDGVTGDLGEPLSEVDDLVNPNGLTGKNPVSATFPQTADLVGPVEQSLNLFEAIDSVTSTVGVSGAAPRHYRPAHRADDPQHLDPKQYPDSLPSGIDFALDTMTGNGVDLQRTPVGGLGALTGTTSPRSGNPMSTLVDGVLTSTTMGVMRNPLEGNSLDGMSVAQHTLGDTTLTMPRLDDAMTDVLYLLGSHDSPADQFTKGVHLGGLSGNHSYGVNGLSNPTDPLADTAILPAPRVAAPAMPGLDDAPGLDNLEGAFSGHLVQTPSVDRLPVQTPALSGLDTRAALPAAPGSSLADTQSRLTGLVGRNPIG